MFGWGQKGHDTTAAIAEAHLTPATRATLDSLLDGRSIIYWANWMDNASHTPTYNYSKTWHYKNVDADQTYESMPKLQSGDIVSALQREQSIILDPFAPQEEKILAIKMIVHLLGDMHQPMHLGHATDLGGNKTMVKYFDTKTNLHSVWDSRLPEAAHKWSYTEWRDQLDRVSDEKVAEIQKGDADDWAKETYEICKKVYAATPQGTTISYNYISEWTPVIEEQFLKGGLRLADVLNALFDSEYKQNNTLVIR